MYAAFFGYYPVIKSFLESKLPRVFEWIVKFLILMPQWCWPIWLSFCVRDASDEMEEFGRYAVPILLGMGMWFFSFRYCFNKSHRRVPAPLAQIVSQAF